MLLWAVILFVNMPAQSETACQTLPPLGPGNLVVAGTNRRWPLLLFRAFIVYRTTWVVAMPWIQARAIHLVTLLV
jgi:hypothetical protein